LGQRAAAQRHHRSTASLPPRADACDPEGIPAHGDRLGRHRKSVRRAEDPSGARVDAQEPPIFVPSDPDAAEADCERISGPRNAKPPHVPGRGIDSMSVHGRRPQTEPAPVVIARTEAPPISSLAPTRPVRGSRRTIAPGAVVQTVPKPVARSVARPPPSASAPGTSASTIRVNTVSARTVLVRREQLHRSLGATEPGFARRSHNVASACAP
jgi:hypothetical protein